MGAIDVKLRVPFGSVNLPGDPHYREGWVRHHLQPLQSIHDPALGPFLLSLRRDGFHMDDFNTNGILLPALPSIGKMTGLPVHIGGHRNYNSRIIRELHVIRSFCESIRAESRRHQLALAGVRGLQDRLRQAIVAQGPGHVDRVVLKGPTDGDLDAMIDRLFSKKMAVFRA